MENPHTEALKVAQETIEIHRNQIIMANNELLNLSRDKRNLTTENDLLKRLLDKHKIKYTK